ncbi:MAG: DUF4884 domain-containing protein [Prolixibacteraceae bacterium]|nr:DUF4884 domain-containing protein [Prolixibacteraceae bacterium]
MKKIFSIIVLFMLFAACSSRRPLFSDRPGNNKTYEVEYLFEYDGCKVYRFFDRGNYVYFTNCKGDVIGFANDSINTRIVNHVK